MALPIYSTGTVAVAASGTVVTGSGVMWSGINAKQGDWISIDGSNAVLITEVTDATHLKIPPWAGAAKSGVSYVIYQNYAGRIVGVAAAEDVSDMLEKLHTDGLPFIVGPSETVPDPSYGDDGQFAFQPSTGQWWTKTGGVWVLSPGLTSDSSKVLKAGDTMTGPLIISGVDYLASLQLTNSQRSKSMVIRMGGASAAPNMEWINNANTIVIASLSDGGVFQTYSNIHAGGNIHAGVSSTTGTYYFGSSGTKSLNYDGSRFNIVGGILSASNRIECGGYQCKQGETGSFGGNCFNLYWTGSSMQLWTDSTNTGTINVTSDYRIKKDIQDAGAALDEIRQWRVITYTGAEYGIYQANEDVRHSFIAHELQAVSPDCVIGEKDAEQLQTLDSVPIIARLAKAVQELLARVEALEANTQ